MSMAAEVDLKVKKPSRAGVKTIGEGSMTAV